MSWRDVFDPYKSHYRDEGEAVRTAHSCGYKFLAWNGDILFIHPNGTEAFDTGIKAESLK